LTPYPRSCQSLARLRNRSLSSCEGRRNTGYHPKRDGALHEDWPYVILNGTTADAFIAPGAAPRQGLPVRSIEQSWFVYPEAPSVPVGPQWRITFWEKHTAPKRSTCLLGLIGRNPRRATSRRRLRDAVRSAVCHDQEDTRCCCDNVDWLLVCWPH